MTGRTVRRRGDCCKTLARVGRERMFGACFLNFWSLWTDQKNTETLHISASGRQLLLVPGNYALDALTATASILHDLQGCDGSSVAGSARVGVAFCP